MTAQTDNRHTGFHFGSDGWFTDDSGNTCSMFGVVEFGVFLRMLDAGFESPIGRKVIYAAADAEEAVLAGDKRFRAGKWFGKRRALASIEQRTVAMGWGVFKDETVSAPCHDGLCVGFALAYKEHRTGKRWKVDWRQVNTELISINYEPNTQSMKPPPPIDSSAWSHLRTPSSLALRFPPEFELRPYGFFLNEERSFFLNVGMMHRLFFELLGRPLKRSAEQERGCVVGGAVEHPDVFSAVFDAAKEAFHQSEIPIYVQSDHDWNDHFQNRITRRGLGSVTVIKTVLNEGQESVFHLQSPLLPYACGLVTAMWERAHGSKGHASISKTENAVVLKVIHPPVDY